MQHNARRPAARASARPGFTLTELLVVIAILAILSALSLAALATAAEQARVDRTRAIVTKLNQLIMERWDGYQTRAVPLRLVGLRGKSEPFVDGNGNGFYDSSESYTDQPPANMKFDYGSAYYRLMAMRELQRMELPDRITDVVNTTTGKIQGTATSIAQTSASHSYFRRVETTLDSPLGASNTDRDTITNIANWSTTYQGAECLYLIIAAMRDGERSALDFFTSDEIGDVDGDGMNEILDGWGNPIEFLRWPAGYTQESGVGDMTQQTNNSTQSPDSFDPLKEDARNTYRLTPLIFSAGPDGEYDINVEGGLDYMNPPTPTTKNDPYYQEQSSKRMVGQALDANTDGVLNWMDNITNHSLGLGAAQ